MAQETYVNSNRINTSSLLYVITYIMSVEMIIFLVWDSSHNTAVYNFHLLKFLPSNFWRTLNQMFLLSIDQDKLAYLSLVACLNPNPSVIAF